MKQIFIITGAPASGKSTTGLALKSILENKGEQVIHINEVNFIDTVVHLFDPEMTHVYKDIDGTLVFKDQHTLESMNKFLFKYVVSLHPNRMYIFELGRGSNPKSIASTYTRVFNTIPKKYLNNTVIINISAGKELRWKRELARKRMKKQYCPNISEYDNNDILSIKNTYSEIPFFTIKNVTSIENLKHKLIEITDEKLKQ